MTLGDITLTAAAPVTLLENDRSPIPSLAQMPAAYAAIVRECRAARPPGRFKQCIK